MSLIPHKADPNYAAQMAEVKNGTYNSGRSVPIRDTAKIRLGRRLIAYFGMAPVCEGSLGSLADKLLADAKGIEKDVNLESARAALTEMGFLS